MTVQWNDAPDLDMDEVRRLATDFRRTDPTNTRPAPDDDPEVLWSLLLLCLVCAVTAPVLALVVVQVVLHWVGAAQLVLATTALTWVCLTVDRAAGTAWAWLRRRSR